jgi:hypothetical protein
VASEVSRLIATTSGRPKGVRPPFLLHDLDFHDQVADTPLGLVELALGWIVLAFLEAGIDARQRPVAPSFELVYRHRYLAGDGIDRLTSQQAQHNFLLAPHRPQPDLGDRAGLASSRATRSCRRARCNPSHLQFVQHFTTPSSDTI